MSNIRFERRDPKSLKNHLLSISIYGTQPPDKAFLDSLDEHGGIHTPLIILNDGTLIAGHRRRQGAIIKAYKEVPCIVRLDLEDKPLEVERMIISSNKDTRVRTDDILAREAAALAEIESKEAAARMKLGGKNAKTDPAPISAQGVKSGETRQNVANTLGIGRNKAAEAITVGTAIKKAEDSGDKETAEKIATVARDQSIHAAATMVSLPKEKPKKPRQKATENKDIPPDLQPIFAWRDKFRAYEKLHNPAIGELAVGFAHEAFEGGNGPLDHKKINDLLGQIYNILMPWQPEKVCQCGGDVACKKCEGRGWIRKGLIR